MADLRHVYEVEIATTVERLWQAITSPDETPNYYLGMTLACDWKPGSPFTYTRPDGAVPVCGVVLEVDPPTRLVTTFELNEGPAANDPPSRVTWQIDAIPGGCRLTLTHEGFETETPTFHGVDEGWNPILAGLKSYLETGQPAGAPGA